MASHILAYVLISPTGHQSPPSSSDVVTRESTISLMALGCLFWILNGITRSELRGSFCLES